MRHRSVGRVCWGVLIGCLLPATAVAQSTIAGLVTDATGGVLPGVTVEAASPALIEKARAVATDAEGRYSIVDVRPGNYTVTFTLAGFTSVRHEGIVVASNATVPINAELRIGAVEETITVSGQTPVVDVQTVTRRETIAREQIDTLPLTRNAGHMLALMPGAKAVITGGRAGVSGATENVFVAGRGLTMYETRWNIDGMDVRTGNLDGLANNRLNEAMVEETTFTTSGQTIDSPTGGISLNMIPREGGNKFSGNFYLSGNDRSWVGSNLTQELIDRGATVTSTLGANADASVSAGGPIARDRIWFYGSWRHQRTLQYEANEFDYQPGVRDETNWYLLDPLPSWNQTNEKNHNNNFSGRLTSQLTQGQKLTAYYDRTFNRDFYSDPAAYVWQPWSSADYVGQAKYTNTVSSRLLIDAGLSVVSYRHTKDFSPLIKADRYSPKWYATAIHQDLDTGRELFQEYSVADQRRAFRKTFSSGATYVTGSHSFRTGVQLANFYSKTHYDINGSLIAQYRTGVGDQVTAYNHPAASDGNVNLELGVYAGDTWAIKRLTLTGGVRFDRFDAGIAESTAGVGRFVKERHQAEYQAPVQNNVSARIGATYDLFGGARTALKFGFGKYLANLGTRVVEAVNPQRQQTQVLDWTDANRDGVPQDNEIESIAAINPDFYNGILATTLDPNWKREYNYETTFGAQHQLRPGLAASAMYFHRQRYNLQVSNRTAVSQSDYFPVDVVTPDGTIVTVYNLPTALRTVYASSPTLMSTEKNSDISRILYDAVEFGIDGRLPGGGHAFGGWSLERNVNVACAARDNPNLLRNCDESRFDIPFRHEFKLAGTQRIPGGVDASVTVNSLAGLPRPVLWTISRTLRYAANCKAPCRPADFVINNPQLNGAAINLAVVNPGTTFYDRYTDVGLGISRVFQLRNGRLRAGLEIFNALNRAAVITQTTNTASAAYGTPTLTQEPRVFRASGRYTF